jgi:hypothetical protein
MQRRYDAASPVNSHYCHGCYFHLCGKDSSWTIQSPNPSKVAEVNNDGDGCLTIMNAALRGNEVIDLVSLQKPKTFIETKIVNKLSQSCSRNTEVPNDASFYSFRVKKNEAKLIGPALAIVGFNSSIKIVRGKVRADLNSDGSLESFRLCTSNEGIHLTVWAGEPLKSKRLWHEYYYLGYDVEPNCTKKDYAQ